MGTRHLVAVKINGEYKVAQYGQWDGNPRSTGRTLLECLRILDLKKLADKCAHAKWISEEKKSKIFKKCGGYGPDYGLFSHAKSEYLKSLHPHLHRDMASQILYIIAKANRGIELENMIEFAKDYVFCEWCYVIDFDKETFEVYTGEKMPRRKKDRFPGTQKWLASFDLYKLPNVSTFYRNLGVNAK